MSGFYPPLDDWGRLCRKRDAHRALDYNRGVISRVSIPPKGFSAAVLRTQGDSSHDVPDPSCVPDVEDMLTESKTGRKTISEPAQNDHPSMLSTFTSEKLTAYFETS